MSPDLIIVLSFIGFGGLMFIFGNLYGRGMQWANYRKLRKSWEKDIEFWRKMYLLVEKHRQEIIVWVCESRGWKIPEFNASDQSDIDFPEESPILEDKG